MLQTIEHSHAVEVERPVFVTDDDRRARVLRRAAMAVAAVACLWVVGLAVGMFGFGNLPGLPLPGVGQHSSGNAPAVEEGKSINPLSTPRERSGAPAVAPARSDGGALGRGTAGSRRSTSAGGRSAARGSGTAVVTPAPPAQQPVNPAQRTRGWARKGGTAPPGQTRKAQPPPPPQSQRGVRRGQQTTTPTTTTPLPPGQQREHP